MDSDTRVVTKNLRMFQNDAALFLLVGYTYLHVYVTDNRQIGINYLNETIRTLRTLNIKN
jgi:hypothetical protein